jgi:hypothetical protein
MDGRLNWGGTTVSTNAYCIFQAKRMLSFGSPIPTCSRGLTRRHRGGLAVCGGHFESRSDFVWSSSRRLLGVSHRSSQSIQRVNKARR